MDFPASHLSYTDSHGDKSSESGWLMLDLKGLDLEGVTKVYLNIDDVEAARDRKAKSESEAERLRNLLGG